MHQKPKKLAELQLGVRKFCGDFNARNKVNEAILNLDLRLLWKILKLDTKVVSQIGTRESLEIAVLKNKSFCTEYSIH